MRKIMKCFIGIICILSVIGTVYGSVALAEEWIRGVVSGNGKLMANDGKTYTIVKNDMGQKLLCNTERNVDVKGAVVDEEGTLTIDVEQYKLFTPMAR